VKNAVERAGAIMHVEKTVSNFHVKYVFHQQRINYRLIGKTLRIQIGMMAFDKRFIFYAMLYSRWRTEL
jgi:hypothetical protein